MPTDAIRHSPPHAMKVAELAPDQRQLLEKVIPQAEVVTCQDAQRIYDTFIDVAGVATTATGYPDQSQMMVGMDDELYRTASDLKNLIGDIDSHNVFVPAPRETFADKIFGGLFSSTPEPKLNNEGLPKGHRPEETDWALSPQVEQALEKTGEKLRTGNS